MPTINLSFEVRLGPKVSLLSFKVNEYIYFNQGTKIGVFALYS